MGEGRVTRRRRDLRCPPPSRQQLPAQLDLSQVSRRLTSNIQRCQTGQVQHEHRHWPPGDPRPPIPRGENGRRRAQMNGAFIPNINQPADPAPKNVQSCFSTAPEAPIPAEDLECCVSSVRILVSAPRAGLLGALIISFKGKSSMTLVLPGYNCWQAAIYNVKHRQGSEKPGVEHVAWRCECQRK